MNKEPYTNKEVDYETNHPVAARLHREGREEYLKSQPQTHEAWLNERTKEMEEAAEQYARDMGWEG